MATILGRYRGGIFSLASMGSRKIGIGLHAFDGLQVIMVLCVWCVEKVSSRHGMWGLRSGVIMYCIVQYPRER